MEGLFGGALIRGLRLALLVLLVEQTASHWAGIEVLSLCLARMMVQRFWWDFHMAASSAVLRLTASQWVSDGVLMRSMGEWTSSFGGAHTGPLVIRDWQLMRKGPYVATGAMAARAMGIVAAQELSAAGDT